MKRNVFHACIVYIFVLLNMFPFMVFAVGYVNVQTTKNSDGSMTTSINAPGSNTTITTEQNGQTTLKKGDGTTIQYKTNTTPTVTIGDTISNAILNSGIPIGGPGSYELLAPIDTFFPGGRVDIKGQGLSGYLNGVYRIGIAVATGLALIMIVVGGLEYVSTDSIQGKSNGKDRIKNSIIGLLLALTSFIIVRQINPNLTRSGLNVEATQSIQGVSTANITLSNGLGFQNDVREGATRADYINTQLINPGQSSYPVGPMVGNAAVAARIVQSARNNMNVSTCMIVTEFGKKGCGYAFGKIMNDAGVRVSGLTPSSVLSTVNIFNALATDRNFYIVTEENILKGKKANMRLTLPGDIIISPTISAEKVGHVGIIETAGAGSIISNSSKAAAIKDYWDGAEWLRYYSGKGLNTYVFRAR